MNNSQNVEAVKLLIQHGANLTNRNRAGQTPLVIARATGNANIISMIEKAIEEGEKEKEAKEA